MQEGFKQEDGIAAVHEAFNLGVNFFDTSPHYGDRKSERVPPFPLLPTSPSQPLNVMPAPQPGSLVPH